jgi:hypothetical protein
VRFATILLGISRSKVLTELSGPGLNLPAAIKEIVRTLLASGQQEYVKPDLVLIAIFLHFDNGILEIGDLSFISFRRIASKEQVNIKPPEKAMIH